MVRHTHADLGERILRQELDAIDIACSRFRGDSELSSLHEDEGRPRRVSALLFEAVRVAREVAELTGGAVDPTVGRALEALGYDRDFEEVVRNEADLESRAERAPGWRLIELDARHRTVRVPAGVHLDLGASAKALVADRAASRIAAELACGVLVSVGGDVAAGGEAPEGGWAIGIAVDSSTSTAAVDQAVSIEAGGLASSSTAVRTWRRGTRQLHHIIDPGTGQPAEPYWTLVSATGRTCVEANAASTAAIVWGRTALVGLETLGLPARLLRYDGRVVTVNGWPEEPSEQPWRPNKERRG
jgi:thiamine biosynthesis lipoprotein